MRVSRLAATVAAIMPLLMACQTTSGTPGAPVPLERAPTREAPSCPPELVAALVAEPLPPEGISQSALIQGLAGSLGDERALQFWKWLTAEYAPWARATWQRVDAARRFCLNAAAR